MNFGENLDERRERSKTPTHSRNTNCGTRMLRKACGSFALMRAGELPGDPEVEEPYSLKGVFEWLRDCPEQIERAVILGETIDRSSPLFVRSII